MPSACNEEKDFEIIDLKLSNQFPKQCKTADVRDANTLRATTIEEVFVNLAAVHRDYVFDKSEYQKTNVEGAENVAREFEDKSINKIFFTKTVEVHGFAEPGTGEASAINPLNQYGRT